MKLLPRVSHRVGTHLVGLAISSDGTYEQEQLRYIASCEVQEPSRLPNGFQILKYLQKITPFLLTKEVVDQWFI